MVACVCASLKIFAHAHMFFGTMAVVIVHASVVVVSKSSVVVSASVVAPTNVLVAGAAVDKRIA